MQTETTPLLSDSGSLADVERSEPSEGGQAMRARR